MKRLAPSAALSRSFKFCSAIVLLALFSLGAATSQAQTPQDGGATLAELFSAEGTVARQPFESSSYQPAITGDRLRERDSIRTAEESRAAIKFDDGIFVRLNELTELTVKASSAPTERPLTLAGGSAYFFSREPRQFPIVETALVSAAVRGTEFTVDVAPDLVTIQVLEGRVDASNQYGAISASGGEAVITRAGQAPVKQILVRPNDAVQWALYYPILFQPADLPDLFPNLTTAQRQALQSPQGAGTPQQLFPGSGTADRVARSYIAYKQGDLARAFKELGQLPTDAPNGAIIYQSALLLAVGKVEASSAALKRIPSGTRSSVALSQEALTRLVQNDRLAAQQLNRQALEVDPKSATAHLMQSYILQATFDLPGALGALAEANTLSPENPTVLARQAELLLGTTDIEEARVLAERAVSLSPDAGYPLTVLGFVYLSEDRIAEAQSRFEAAIAAEQGNGLPHLGLGLALIRSGDLEAGREQLQKAVHLEPSVALYRSYLGKAFFEEERENLALREFDRAKELDPRDPTPYLYSAFSKLSQFQPVAALREIQGSIERNEDRAVYRSKFYLDQDLATRGTGLSQIYNAVSFPELARVEALKSLTKDYSNYSAHSLLADSYGSISQLAAASISENIISDILFPVNFNVLLPSSGGSTSLNEYTTLFDRPQSRTLLQGLYSSGKEEYGGEALFVQSFGDFAYRARASYFKADGTRGNDDYSEPIYSVNARYQLTPQTKISAAVGRARGNTGDQSRSFDPETIDLTAANSIDTITRSVSFQHQFSQRSQLIGQLAHSEPSLRRNSRTTTRGVDLTVRFRDEDLSTFIPVTVENSSRTTAQGLRSSVQHIYAGDEVSLVTGVEILDADQSASDEAVVISDRFNLLSGLNLSTAGTYNQGSEQFYSYLTYHAADWIDLTLGGNYTSIELPFTGVAPPFVNGEQTEDEFSPKFGFLLTPASGVTIRAAAFDSLGISGFSDLESFEPTFVGGINQVLGDLPGARLRSVATGIDVTLSPSTFVGIEATRRENSQPLPDINVAVIADFDQRINFVNLSGPADPDQRAESEDHFLRSYLYQVLGDRWTGTLNHSFVHSRSKFFMTKNRLHRVVAGLNYFDPSGFFAFGSATYRHQELDGFPQEGKNDKRDFWIVNSGLGWQLPRRGGTVILGVQNAFDSSENFEQVAGEPLPPVDLSVSLGFSISF